MKGIRGLLIKDLCLMGEIRKLLLIILFVKSYKKQTDYVRRQVEKYVNEQNSSQ